MTFSITGTVRSTVSLGGTTFGSSSSSEIDAFVAKYDQNGNFKWVKTVGNTLDNEAGVAVAADDLGNVYLAGTFESDSIIVGSTTLTRDYIYGDGYFIKYDLNGNVVWAKNLGTSIVASGRAVVVKGPNEIYLGGYYRDPGTFDGIPLSPVGNLDLFVLKLNSSGVVSAAASAGGTGREFMYGMACDQNGDVLICGQSYETATFGSHTVAGTHNEILQAKYSTASRAIFDSLSGGNYTIVATDTVGCTAASSLNAVVSGGSSTIVASASVTTILACPGSSSGAVSSAVSGGSTPYSYLWSNGNTAANISGLSNGTYTLTVTDASGCSDTAQVTLQAPVPIAVSGLTTPETGSSNGAINITTTGGTSPYSYAWSNGSFNEDQTGLNAGTYTVTITDFYLCSIVDSFTVLGTLNLSGTTTDVSCGGTR